MQSFAASEVWIDDGTGTSTQHTTAGSGYGSGGGTWNWNGADDLALDNYVGSNIAAEGNLNINVTGTNKVEATTPDGDTKTAIAADGDLKISGDGTLEATSTNNSGQAVGIAANNGNVTIDGTTVTATATATSSIYSASGIASDDGDVNILNGANVSSSATSFFSKGIESFAGNINITDSTVVSTSTLPRGDGLGFGLFAFTSGNSPIFINITNSKVTAKGNTAAMITTATRATGSKINIKNALIQTTGAHVQDCRIVNNDTILTGQLIGSGTKIVTSFDSSDILKEVVIEKIPAATVTANTVKNTVAGSSVSVLGVKTGDTSTNMFAWLVLMLIAMIAFVRIRSHANSLLCR